MAWCSRSIIFEFLAQAYQQQWGTCCIGINEKSRSSCWQFKASNNNCIRSACQWREKIQSNNWICWRSCVLWVVLISCLNRDCGLNNDVASDNTLASYYHAACLDNTTSPCEVALSSCSTSNLAKTNGLSVATTNIHPIASSSAWNYSWYWICEGGSTSTLWGD